MSFTRLAGFVAPDGLKAYFFLADSYVRYDVAADAADPGYPLKIADHWPGLFDKNIDAALCWPDGSVYFFKGEQYSRYDLSADKVDDGYPKPIADFWPGLFPTVDSAVLWSSGNVYIFSGDQYIQYDAASDKAADGYPKPIAENWPGLYDSGLEAALMWPNGNAYFFKVDQYVQYDAETNRVADGYPKQIEENWAGLKFMLTRVGLRFNDAPVTPPDGGSATGSAASVRDFFPEFSKPLEGRVPYMYQDIKGLVTVAVGNLIDTPDEAAALPFEHKDTHAAASRDEIVAEWNLIKNAPGLATGGHPAAKKIHTLELSEQAMDDLVKRKFDVNEARLAAFYPDWASWPADARLGAHSIAWSGSFFPNKWPNFNTAANAGDWTAAATDSHLQEEGNPGIKHRNTANHQLFTNAAAVVAQGLDRSKIYYPTAL